MGFVNSAVSAVGIVAALYISFFRSGLGVGYIRWIATTYVERRADAYGIVVV